MKRALRLLAGLLGLGLATILGLAAAIDLQYHEDDHPIALPPPRGPHSVGRILADWHDVARGRELMVFLWYPAQDGAAGRHPEYIPGKWGELEAKGMVPIPAKRLREIRVSAIENAPLFGEALPVLVMLPGMGRIPAQYSALAEDLASYGYLIIGVTPTGSSRPVVFSDGRVVWGSDNVSDPGRVQKLVATWGADASFALDEASRDARFASHIDPTRVGIFGHSFGGDVATRAPHRDPRFLRAADMDGAFLGASPVSLDTPLLILESGDDRLEKDVCGREPMNCEVHRFPKARHMDFSDACLLPSRFPLPKSMMLLGDVDGSAFLHDVSDRLRAFFGRM